MREKSDAEEEMKHRLVLTLSLVGLLLYGSAASANAVSTHQGATSSARHAASSQSRYCVALAQPAGSSRTPTARCYSTFAASVKAATGGRVRLPASATSGSVTPDELNAGAVTPDATVVLSIDYRDANFNGPALIWSQSTSCGSFQAASMPSGWNDVVSSVVTKNGCANTLYKNINFGGTTFSIGRNTSVASLGSFNDQTSSEKWCTSKPCG
jgi:hypothetical protein